MCAAEPEMAAQRLVDAGISPGYDVALQTLNEVPYGTWREYHPEDTMRFFALRLHEAGMIEATPNNIIAEGTDWRFLGELKRELKA
jgi:NitT/TauT family transport system substrate-binding protein